MIDNYEIQILLHPYCNTVIAVYNGIYTAFHSLDGENFEEIGAADLALKDIKAGLMVGDGIITGYMKSTFWFDSSTTKPDSPFDVAFDYFRITNSGQKQ